MHRKHTFAIMNEESILLIQILTLTLFCGRESKARDIRENCN